MEYYGLTEASFRTGISPHALRRLANFSVGGKHMPKIPHVRVGQDGRPSADGRRGRIMISELTCRQLKKNPPTR